MIAPFPCYLVRKRDDGTVEAGVETITLEDLPAGDVVVRVDCSSLNYKDAMAARGHPGIVRRFPHVPGVDAAGHVVSSSDAAFHEGDPVLVTGYRQGAEQWGGYAAYVRVPAGWVVPLPDGMTLQQSMAYGTAGFTAAQSVAALMRNRVEPSDGQIVVTGATGGVGSLSVALLAKAKFQVVAVTGKAAQHDFLRQLGAVQILSREDVHDTTDRPLLASRWAGAVDTVGGVTLSTVLRSIGHRGCVAACGLVGGTDIPVTVYPFILRGVTLAGIDSAQCPMDERLWIWNQLAGPWKLDNLESMITTVDLSGLDDRVDDILAGKIAGRVLVRPTA